MWRSADYGSRWEQIAEDGFGNPNTGAVPVLQSFRDVWGGIHIYASAMNHPDGSTVYKHQSSGRWDELPYVSGFGRPAPITSVASFEGRLFIGEGQSEFGAKLFYTITGEGWTQDGVFARPYDFTGSGGEQLISFNALTPAQIGIGTARQKSYAAVPYRGAGVKIWRRTLDVWDTVVASVYRAAGVVLPSRWRCSIL